MIENIIRKNKPTNIRLIEEMREGKKINETDAGRELNKKIDIEEMTRQAHQKQEMQEQIRANNQAQLDMLIGMLKEANEAKRPRLPGKGKAL